MVAIWIRCFRQRQLIREAGDLRRDMRRKFRVNFGTEGCGCRIFTTFENYMILRTKYINQQ